MVEESGAESKRRKRKYRIFSIKRRTSKKLRVPIIAGSTGPSLKQTPLAFI